MRKQHFYGLCMLNYIATSVRVSHSLVLNSYYNTIVTVRDGPDMYSLPKISEIVTYFIFQFPELSQDCLDLSL